MITDSTTLAVLLTKCLNALGLLAAPRTWASAAQSSGAEGLRAGIAETLSEAAAGLSALDTKKIKVSLLPIDLETATDLLGQLSERGSRWSEGPPSEELVSLARQALDRLGVPEPRGGWEGFQLDDVE